MSRLISCVVTAHDRPSLVKRAVASVRAQTYPDVELIIVDDGSTEEAAAAVRDLAARDDRTELVRHERPRGPMAARNAGVGAAAGSLVAFLDDDDEWLPGKLEAQEPYADDHSMVSCTAMIRTRSGRSPQVRAGFDVLTQDFEELFRSSRFLYPSGLLLRTEVFRGLGGFEDGFAEWDFFLRAADRYGPAAVVGEPLVLFDRLSTGRRHSDVQWSDPELFFRVYRRHHGQVDRRVRRRKRAQLHFKAARHASSAGAKLAHGARAVLADPSFPLDLLRRAGRRLLP